MIHITKDEDKVPYWFTDLQSHRKFQSTVPVGHKYEPAYPETELELIQPNMNQCSMRILGLDPGKNHCAWGEIRVPTPGNWKGKPNLVGAGLAMKSSWMDMVSQIPVVPDILVLELMRIYPHSKEDPNDLVDVASTGSFIAGHLCWHDTIVLTPTPAEWKGNVPKTIHHKRLAKEIPGAKEAIKNSGVPVGQQHHLWDACGLAWYGWKKCCQS